MSDIIKCEDCIYLKKWRTPEQAEQFGQIYECELDIMTCPSPDDYCSKAIKKKERLICNSCRKKYECRHYGFAKEFIKENPKNDMKCEIYEKEY